MVQGGAPVPHHGLPPGRSPPPVSRPVRAGGGTVRVWCAGALAPDHHLVKCLVKLFSSAADAVPVGRLVPSFWWFGNAPCNRGTVVTICGDRCVVKWWNRHHTGADKTALPCDTSSSPRIGINWAVNTKQPETSNRCPFSWNGETVI